MLVTSTDAPPMAELHAPASWRTVDFISDLHLHESEPATFSAWQSYMRSTPADALLILGDLFEVWVGDDAVNEAASVTSVSFEGRCAHVLSDTASRLPVYFMHGNRDFLVGQSLMDLCNMTLLADPTLLVFKHHRWLLSHGDALCLDDGDYMAFREQVRGCQWQQDFLAKPLAERRHIARSLRALSETRKASGAPYPDLDPTETRAWLQAANSPTLIHGHTHKPAIHDLGSGLSRVVLSDWDLAAIPPRAEVLRLSAQGLQRVALA